MEKIEKFEGHRDRSYYLDIFRVWAHEVYTQYLSTCQDKNIDTDDENDPLAVRYREASQIYNIGIYECETPEDFNAIYDRMQELREFILPEIRKFINEHLLADRPAIEADEK